MPKRFLVPDMIFEALNEDHMGGDFAEWGDDQDMSPPIFKQEGQHPEINDQVVSSHSNCAFQIRLKQHFLYNNFFLLLASLADYLDTHF